MISNLTTEDSPFLKFRLSDVDTSIANGLRRIIVAEIPTVVFRTSPYEKSLVTFIKNTTRLNNELIAQRLSCIPIHISDTDFPIENYQVEVEKKNDSDSIQFVTTQDFKIKDIQTGTYLTDKATKTIFPPNKITGDYIDFVRLRPRISDDIPGEELKFTCKFDIGTSQQDSAFNVAATCSYSATTDPIKINEAWTKKEVELKNEGLTKEDIEFAKKDWMILDAKRNIVPNSFEFIIETVGPFSNMSIIYKAVNVMIAKLKNFQNIIQTRQEELIIVSDTTIENSYDITLPNEGYTIGKVIEYYLYSVHYEKGGSLTYCGFKKPHPHIDQSLIRVGFKEKFKADYNPKNVVVTYLVEAAETAIEAYKKIGESFISDE
jgi:DNA-directed RNA polymerase II subunit RPB3